MALIWFHGGHSNKRAFGILCLIAGASFALSLYWTAHSLPNAFFRTETRIWEIAAGGLLVLASKPLARTNRFFLSIVAWLGVAGMLASITLFDDRLAYPGCWALLPVLATVAVIAGGNASSIAPVTILRLAPLQWVGRRSYSIYLWHWPLLVLAPLAFPEFPHAHWIALALVVPIASAAFSIVEAPIRQRARDARSGRTFAYAAAGCGLVILASAAASHLDWIHGAHYAEIARRVRQAKLDAPNFTAPKCDTPATDLVQRPCLFGNPDSRTVVALFGDSYAEHLFDGVNAAAQSSGWALQVWTKSGCPPIDPDYNYWTKRGIDQTCTPWREMVIHRLIADRPALVLISSSSLVARNLADPNTGRLLAPNESVVLWQRGFSALLHRLSEAGLRLIVVRDTPRGRKDVLDCLVRFGERDCDNPRRSSVDQADIEVAQRVPNVAVLDLTDHFCGPTVCDPVKNGIIVYRDGAYHLTATFARTLAPEFQRLLVPPN
jgi:SGNH domain-containing protein